MPWALIRAAMASPARLAVIPMQDALELGSAHRMNTPGTTKDNWRWRFDWADVPPERAGELLELNTETGRTTALRPKRGT
jgi:4-alpha-glucanotransferase